MLNENFIIEIQASQNFLVFILILILSLWLSLNIILIIFDLLNWIIMFISQSIKRTQRISVYLHSNYDSYNLGTPQNIANKPKYIYGKDEVNLNYIVLIIYKVFTNILFLSAKLPFHDDLEDNNIKRLYFRRYFFTKKLDLYISFFPEDAKQEVKKSNNNKEMYFPLDSNESCEIPPDYKYRLTYINE